MNKRLKSSIYGSIGKLYQIPDSKDNTFNTMSYQMTNEDNILDIISVQSKIFEIDPLIFMIGEISRYYHIGDREKSFLENLISTRYPEYDPSDKTWIVDLRKYPWLFNENYGYTYEMVQEMISVDIDHAKDMIDQIKENHPELLEKEVIQIGQLSGMVKGLSINEKENFIEELLESDELKEIIIGKMMESL